MKSLPVLIKLARRKVDAAAKDLSDVDQKISKAENGLRALKTNAARESAGAGADPLSIEMLSRYKARVAAQCSGEEDALSRLRHTRDTLRHRLMEAFREQEKYLALEKQLAEAERLETRLREQAELDDVSLRLSKRQG